MEMDLSGYLRGYSATLRWPFALLLAWCVAGGTKKRAIRATG